MKQFDYHLIQDSLQNLQLSFEIPFQDMASVGEALQYHFPDMIDPFIKELLTAVHSERSFKGDLAVENRALEGRILKLRLEDGIYGYGKSRWELGRFEMQIGGSQLNFSAATQHERYPFQIFGWMHWPECQYGQAALVSSQEEQHLLIKWEKDINSQFALKSVKGAFGGCHFDLAEDSESQAAGKVHALKGSVSLEFNRLCALLPIRMAEKIKQMKLGSFYALQGTFWIDSKMEKNWLETLFFSGILNSQEVILKGYQLQNVHAAVNYAPGRLDIQNFVLEDEAGTLKVPSVVAWRDPKQDIWSLFIPSLSVRNLRISSLRDTEGSKISTRSKFRSLLVKRMDLRDFAGELNRQETWQAKGDLHFANPVRKNLFHPLFAIPGEILLRLGLDPNVLNPVTGTVHFNLQGDKFYLTRMKDVYSEGRGSKFYLAGGSVPSWIDFDGNLSVQIRMKQYNLIFKLAELFTVSVEGNIRKPRYSLNKNQKASQKEAFAL